MNDLGYQNFCEVINWKNMQRKSSMKIVLKNYNDRIIFGIIKDFEVEYIF